MMSTVWLKEWDNLNWSEAETTYVESHIGICQIFINVQEYYIMKLL